MTTIAYKDGVMAADTRTTLGDGRHRPGTHVDKIYFIGGGLMGLAGDADTQHFTEEFLKNITNEEEFYKSLLVLAEHGSDVSCILVFRNNPDVVIMGGTYKEDGDEKYLCQVYSTRIEEGYGIGIGSGSKYAEVAMSMGDSAAGGVFHAMDFDPGTGGEVWEYSFE